jgi:hypothetical protein
MNDARRVQLHDGRIDLAWLHLARGRAPRSASSVRQLPAWEFRVTPPAGARGIPRILPALRGSET